ncbi:FAD-dependent oxidoreductase [Halobaculum sp. WSA2]|uniref:FAD-dependent oxidoreductase n=1 Tax=Halobaculum saliterrae TaxID=2073113 RepID=A0A6B0SPT9_9EURY|nr:FAD-dependent oxidoreductase [Halobaculum saliterrae]MXR40447.1 FAD-dependent oxidoreductase [Halobaculum saliterrae]
MSDTFVVTGGDAAGMSAASEAKREDPDLDVGFEKGEWVSYAACGMPYYVKGEVEDLQDLVAVTPEEFRNERDIDLWTGHEVVGIDPEAGSVTVEADGETFDQPYDHLLVATAFTAGMTEIGLRNTDLAYAPPFSPVWDSILPAAKVLGGKVAGE